MGIFEQLPYTNFHNLNLDWILKTIQDLYTKTITWIENNNIQFNDPLDWEIGNHYSANRIVWDDSIKSLYISKKVVPAGVQIDNLDYWIPVANTEVWPRYSAADETATFRGTTL